MCVQMCEYLLLYINVPADREDGKQRHNCVTVCVCARKREPRLCSLLEQQQLVLLPSWHCHVNYVQWDSLSLDAFFLSLTPLFLLLSYPPFLSTSTSFCIYFPLLFLSPPLRLFWPDMLFFPFLLHVSLTLSLCIYWIDISPHTIFISLTPSPT